MRFLHRRHEDESGPGWLVAGLGNPGKQYERTRHNVGFMVVDTLAERYHLRFSGTKHQADTARLEQSGVSALLAKPVTFMNDSGYAVGRLSRYFHIPPSHVLVICDDLDLPFGTIRVRPGGSSGGQRGLHSVIQVLGTSDIPRLRLGVGRPQHNAVQHVLQPFGAEEAAKLPGLLDVAADAVMAVLERGVQDTMNRYNRDWSTALTG